MDSGWPASSVQWNATLRGHGSRSITDGELHFTVEYGDETGPEERQEAGAEAVARLLALARSLDLEGVPRGLAGAQPWCDIVINDARPCRSASRGAERCLG